MDAQIPILSTSNNHGPKYAEEMRNREMISLSADRSARPRFLLTSCGAHQCACVWRPCHPQQQSQAATANRGRELGFATRIAERRRRVIKGLRREPMRATPFPGRAESGALAGGFYPAFQTQVQSWKGRTDSNGTRRISAVAWAGPGRGGWGIRGGRGSQEWGGDRRAGAGRGGV